MSLRFGLFAILFALLGCRVSAQDTAPQSSTPPTSSTSENPQAGTAVDRQVETSNPSTGTYRVGAGMSAPKVTHCHEPEYSGEARKARYQGTVVLRLIVDAQGKPQKIKIQRSLGMGLDQQAVEAVKQWRFEPAKKDGRPVAVVINVEINFHLYDGLVPHPESSGEPPKFPGVNLYMYPLIVRVKPAFFEAFGSGYNVNYKAEFMNGDKPWWQIISCFVTSSRCLPLYEGTYPGRWEQEIMGKLEILGSSKDKGKNWTAVEYSPIAIPQVRAGETGCLKRGSEGNYFLTTDGDGDNLQLWSNSVNLAEHVMQVVTIGGNPGYRRPALPLALITYRLVWDGGDGQQHQGGTTETGTEPPTFEVLELEMVSKSCTQ